MYYVALALDYDGTIATDVKLMNRPSWHCAERRNPAAS